MLTVYSNAVVHAAIGQDTNFRIAVQRVRTMLAAGGWVQQADTGQIDPVTVAAPGAAYAGFEIWRSIAPNVNCHDLFMRLEYWGATWGGQTVLTFKISLGWATDGAGNLTGVYTSQSSPIDQVSYSTSTTITELPIMADADGLFCYFGTTLDVCYVERQRDTFGEPTDDVFLYTQNIVSGIGVRFDCQMLSWGKVWQRVTNSTNFPILNPGVLVPVNGRVPVGFLFGVKAGFTNPSESIMLTPIAANSNGFMGPKGSSVALTIYGHENTYYQWSGGTAFGVSTMMYLLKTN